MYSSNSRKNCFISSQLFTPKPPSPLTSIWTKRSKRCRRRASAGAYWKRTCAACDVRMGERRVDERCDLRRRGREKKLLLGFQFSAPVQYFGLVG
ncbi:hypothetical protein V6Z11_D02G231300 [Gossypium hirsutum]